MLLYECVYMCVYAGMYVCMSMLVCMYVCMYVCMFIYACVYACLYVCMYVCMYVFLVSSEIDAVGMKVCMYACMYGRMTIDGFASKLFSSFQHRSAYVILCATCKTAWNAIRTTARYIHTSQHNTTFEKVDSNYVCM